MHEHRKQEVLLTDFWTCDEQRAEITPQFAFENSNQVFHMLLSDEVQSNFIVLNAINSRQIIPLLVVGPNG
jgi:hypothetical protein